MRRTLPRKIGVRTRARDVTGPRVSLYESYNTHASGSGLARVFNCHICHDHFATSYKKPPPFPLPHSLPIRLQRRTALTWRIAESCLHKRLLHILALAMLIEDIVDDIQLVDGHAVRDHIEGVELAVLDHLEELFPVFVYRRLTVADEADTALH